MRDIIVILCFCVSFHLCVSQRIKITEEQSISTGIDFPLYEPHFIIDPLEPNHFLVASILITEWKEGVSAKGHIVLFQSWDAGKTWETKHFNRNNIASGYDPYLAMNTDGTVVLTSLNTFTDQRFLHLISFVSKDGGKTWNDSYTDYGISHDRQSIVVEPKRQKFIMVSSSFNRTTEQKGMRGLSFTVLNRNGILIESNWHEIFNVNKDNGEPLITKDGNLIVPLIDYSLNNKLLNTRRNWIVTSTDLGRTLSAPIMISEDGSFPHIILDTLDVNQPKLHHIQGLGKFREYKGFSASTSSDGGYTWSKKVDVTKFKGEKPYIRNANWAINNQGIIGVLWFDRRDAEKDSHDLFFSYSTNQGKTFQPPMKVSSKSSTPKPEKYRGDRRWPVGGEYFGLKTGKNGKFHVVWADQRDEKSSLYMATIIVDP